MSQKLALRILGLFFWWYLVVFVLSVAQIVGVSLPQTPLLEYRGFAYAWDFELMFTALFLIWGVFLWKASNEPSRHALFISFTIWATFAHIVTMIVIGLVRPEDLAHLLRDAIALAVPLGLLVYARKKEGKTI